jgi:hypothetical protein
MRVVLRGRRSCLLWISTFLCVAGLFTIGISMSALTVAFGSPIPSALLARLPAPPAADVVQVVRSYREGERAALLTLDEDVLAQLPVFVQGEALDELTRRVHKLRADGYYQKLASESFEVVQVIEDEPRIYVMTIEVLTVETYPQAAGGAAAQERKTVSLEVVYHLVHEAERWKITKVVATER